VDGSLRREMMGGPHLVSGHPQREGKDTLRDTRSILVVDDDEQVLMVWRGALKKYAHCWSVQTATDGFEALVKMATTPFDLVVTDLKMPGFDGCQLTQLLRLYGQNAIVIWITAFPEPESEALAKSLAVYCCLYKPVSVAEIRQVVAEALETKPV
jgi:CheY-like chemotaxis protein